MSRILLLLLKTIHVVEPRANHNIQETRQVLHFVSNLISVSKLILHLSLKQKNHFRFSLCRQPTNRKVLCDKVSVLFTQ